jgi:glycosyltransferase involved in cell wall biosynthesis
MDVAAEAAVPLVLEWNTSEVWKRRNWEPTGPLDRLFDRSLARMERSVVSNADLVVAVSARAAEMAVECGAPKERVATVPNAVRVEGIAVARPAPGGSVAKGVGTVGWIGTFGPWHGAEVLIKALEHLGPGVRLRMIGDGVGRQKCVQLAKQLGVAERIEWTGVLPHDEALAALGACDVLASPHVQLDDRPFFGSPIKIFEYMGLGRPIVASRLEQLDEVLEDARTGRLVTPGDPRELAAAIEEILAMPDRGSSLGAAALEEARRSHTWDRRASAILGALRLQPPELPDG